MSLYNYCILLGSILYRVGGSLPVFGPYLSEFAGSKYRGSYLNFMSTSWITGAVAVTGVAWVLLPHEDIGLTVNGTSVHSWRVFLFICAVPAFVGGVLCILMPEGPRYLIEVCKVLLLLLLFIIIIIIIITIIIIIIIIILIILIIIIIIYYSYYYLFIYLFQSFILYMCRLGRRREL